jgi:lysophospholipase L1-like esterase
MLLALTASFLAVFGIQQKPVQTFAIKDGQTVLFLGDSNTAAGGFVQEFETYLYTDLPKLHVRVINLGLPSEGVTGLSEPDHPFPRPNVHDRLDRALELAKPDWVIACYGMNDGIYYPLSKERFAAYKAGITKLIDKVKATKAKLVLMTPPPFDPNPVKSAALPKGAAKYSWMTPYKDYDEVIEVYSRWVIGLKSAGVRFVDLHSAVQLFLGKGRGLDPTFALSGDGVHLNDKGHKVIAAEILVALGALNIVYPAPSNQVPGGLLLSLTNQTMEASEAKVLIVQRERILHDSWLSHVGHKRPGMQPGLPLDEAEKKATELDTKIRILIQRGPIK